MAEDGHNVEDVEGTLDVEIRLLFERSWRYLV